MTHNEIDPRVVAAEQGEATIGPNTTVYTGVQARDYIRKMFPDGLGEAELKAMIGGRPSLDPHGGTSPGVQVRMSYDLLSKLDKYATAHGKKRSEVVREAVAAYVAA